MVISKKNLQFSSFWMTAFILFWIGGCNKPVDIDLNPTISVQSHPSGIYVSPKDTLSLKIRLTALDGFQSFRIQEVSTGVILSMDQDDLGKGSVLDSTMHLELSNNVQGDSLIYELILTDKKNRVDFEKLSFSVANPIDTFSWVFGIPKLDSLNSFFNSNPFLTYDLVNATTNSGSVDLGFTRDSLLWMVAAPADSMFSQVLVPEVGFWTILNQTILFETSITVSEFNQINTDGPIWDSFYPPLLSNVDSLKINQVFSFLTVDTLAGIGLVEDIQLADTLPPGIKIIFKVQR